MRAVAYLWAVGIAFPLCKPWWETAADMGPESRAFLWSRPPRATQPFWSLILLEFVAINLMFWLLWRCVVFAPWAEE